MNTTTRFIAPADPAVLARCATVRPPEFRSPAQIKRQLRTSQKAVKTKLAWMPMKQFCAEEGARDGVKAHTIWQRINRGHYKGCLRFKRVNPRVILVIDTRAKS